MEKNLKYLKHLESIDKSLKVIAKELKKSNQTHVTINCSDADAANLAEEVKKSINRVFEKANQVKI